MTTDSWIPTRCYTSSTILLGIKVNRWILGSRFQNRIDKYNGTISFLIRFPHSFFWQRESQNVLSDQKQSCESCLASVAAEQSGRWMKRNTVLKFYSFACNLDGQVLYLRDVYLWIGHKSWYTQGDWACMREDGWNLLLAWSYRLTA